MSWTEVFPIFDEDAVDEFERLVTPEERAELEEWFGVERVYGARDLPHVVSFSLFWKPVRTNGDSLPPPSREVMEHAVDLGHAPRFDPWSHYVAPLLEEVPALRQQFPEITFRVYLAKDLDFLIDELVAAGCEVHWMKHSSIAFAPGGLWRFLPIGEEGRLVTVADVDRMENVPEDIARTEAMSKAGLGLWRVPVFGDLATSGAVCYLPVIGCQSGWKGGCLPVRNLLDAFTWKCIRGEMPSVVDYPHCGPRPVLRATWPDYGFDEWFLMAAVYPRIAQEGVLTFLPTSAKGQLLTLDIEYVTWANPGSQLVFFPVENCCGGAPLTDGVAVDGLDSFELPPSSEDQVEAALQEALLKSEQVKEARLGLLFLTRGDVHHPEIWREFVSQAPEQVRVFSHPKDPDEAESGFLAGSVVDEHHETEWGDISLVRGSLAMLRRALEDEELTHFVLLSEHCVPVRPLQEMLGHLQRCPFPRMKLTPLLKASDEQRRRAALVPQLPDSCWRFHSQWWLLDRVAAHCLTRADYTKVFAQSWVPDESYFGTVLSLLGYPVAERMIDRDVTWTEWISGASSPSSHLTLSVGKLAAIVESGAWFARKFPADSDIGSWGLHLPAAPETESPVPEVPPTPIHS